MLSFIKKGLGALKSYSAAVAAAAFVLAVSCGSAHAAVTLPNMPVDFADYATAGMTVVGTVLGSIAGIVVVVSLVKMGLRYLTRAFSGHA